MLTIKKHTSTYVDGNLLERDFPDDALKIPFYEGAEYVSSIVQKLKKNTNEEDLESVYVTKWYPIGNTTQCCCLLTFKNYTQIKFTFVLKHKQTRYDISTHP